MSFWVSIPFDNFISYFDFYYCVAKAFVAFILRVSSGDDTRFHKSFRFSLNRELHFMITKQVDNEKSFFLSRTN